MKSLFYIYFIGVIISAIFLSGCELLTKQPEKIKAQQPGNDLVISEVFTLSPDKYYNYSWIEIFNPTKAKIPWFYDPKVAVVLAVGSDGTVISTIDNAKTWNKVDMPLNYRNAKLNGLSFFTADLGFIVGDNGLIFQVIRANQRFIINDTIVKNLDPRKKNLNDIFLLQFPSKAGIAVGDSGLILRTITGGKTWIKPEEKGRVRFNLRSCWFIDLVRIYAVGDSGTILRFHGGSWQKKNPPDEFPKTNFKSVFFFNDTGFVVGENGAIAGTKNAGESWRALPSNVTTTLRHVVFGQTTDFDRRTGWAVGDEGVILKSTDYGETWERKEIETNVRFNHVSFVDDISGFVLGEGGVVFSTSDRGETWDKIKNIPLSASSLNSSYLIPIRTIKITERYVLEIRALRREFFTQINYGLPPGGIVNYDVTTTPEVGMILIDPKMLLELPEYWKRFYISIGVPLAFIPPVPDVLMPIFGSKNIDSIMSGGFTIINNDSDRFDNHIKPGPGIGQVVKANIGYIYDSTAIHGIRWFLWDLLPSSEIRLVKYRVETDNGVIINPKPPITVDIVRWGYYLPDSVAFPGEPRWENNKPSGFIPEWYSLARYANDVGKSNPAELSTIESFYFAKDPIPRWNSQRRK